MNRVDRIALLLDSTLSAEDLIGLGVTARDALDAVGLVRLDLELTRRAALIDARAVVADANRFLRDLGGASS